MIEDMHLPHCQELLGSLSDYIDGALSAELCLEIEEHMKDCHNCRVVVNTLRKTVELYQQSSEASPLPGAVRERLFYKLHLEDFLSREPSP